MSEIMDDVGKPAVETVDLWRIYKTGSLEVPALRGVNLCVEQGSFIVVKGRSGSGKTTLLNCIGGLDQPTKGSVHIMGQELAGMDDEALTRWRGKQVGFVFQSFGLLPTLSAFENVELMLRLTGQGVDRGRQRAMYCLELVGLKKWVRHRPYEMSGGQQQRVAIARALANNPILILADEPTGELDSSTSREIYRLFRRIVDEERVTLILSSHDPLADEYVDTIYQLRDGQIVNSQPRA
jgi:ABC-type lipoprotein export system ATPase subunit